MSFLESPVSVLFLRSLENFLLRVPLFQCTSSGADSRFPPGFALNLGSAEDEPMTSTVSQALYH
jgi:hypothetical protein